MQNPASAKYRPFPPIHLPDRQWPNRVLTAPPIWCSVDLRDGNQALAIPMNVSQKLEMFDALVRCGFKEIEVGFPAASNTEFAFMRRLIEEKRIPDDVTIQVLVQAREDLIERTVESLVGAKNAIIHLYNSTSPAQRRVVFGLEKPEIVAIARRGTRWVRERAHRLPGTNLRFQYSPESFSATEVEFALEICEAVIDEWQPTPDKPIILNLPDTVEVAMPNVYADQVEWFIRHLRNPALAIISLHTHNDRGTGVAATELGLLAGAHRVEGTLFGNGERTGNLDVVIVALNLYMHGIDPGLNLSDLNALRHVYERCTGMTIPPRQPYAGELVFTAFSGSHQDAIKKSWEKQKPGAPWDVLYIPIDPADIGRSYKAIIRINSQSGKGGVAYLLENEFGYSLPKLMHKEIGRIVNDLADATGRELTAAEIHDAFQREYLARTAPVVLKQFKTTESDSAVTCTATIMLNGETHQLTAEGNGPIDAFVRALGSTTLPKFEVLSYAEHSLGKGAEARAVSYIQIKTERGHALFGAGIDTNIELASIKAIVSALNRALAKA